MSEAYLGEIRMFGFNFAPSGWAMCNGQLLPINQFQALFSLLGTFYGGNGTTTFALPNLQSRVAVHFGQGPGLSNYVLGAQSGVESVSLTSQQMPAHNHIVNCNGVTGLGAASPNVFGESAGDTPVNNFPARAASAASAVYSANASANGQTMNPNMLTVTGGSQPHENRQPFLVLNFCIALTGIFPARN
jgi:microcystin-dependent protein